MKPAPAVRVQEQDGSVSEVGVPIVRVPPSFNCPDLFSCVCSAVMFRCCCLQRAHPRRLSPAIGADYTVLLAPMQVVTYQLTLSK